MARELLEDGGAEALSMRKLGAAVGIQAASLYAHFPNKDAVEAAVVGRGVVELTESIARRAAGGQHSAPLVAEALRLYARAHPAVYRLMTRDATGQLWRVLEENQPKAARESMVAVLAFARGVIDFELDDHCPAGIDLDTVWNAGLAALTAD